jgi:hypothetical protein
VTTSSVLCMRVTTVSLLKFKPVDAHHSVFLHRCWVLWLADEHLQRCNHGVTTHVRFVHLIVQWRGTRQDTLAGILHIIA